MRLLVLVLASCAIPGCGSGAAPSAVVAVTVSPASTVVIADATRRFFATVINAQNTAVTWTVLGGNTNGTIDGTGLYVAPNSVPANPAVSVRALSVADPAAWMDATVLISPAPPQPPPPPATLSVPLTVATQTGWSATAAPVTSGVPLPVGAHTDASSLRITTQAGAAVPAQFRVLSRWSDGSIRWVLADFMANLGTGSASYVLASGGPGPLPPDPLDLTESATAIDVDAGPLLFRISKSGFRLFESVRIDRDGDGSVDDECLDSAALEGIVVRDGGVSLPMDQIAPDRVTIEEAGPLRCCIRVEGRHRASPGGADLLRYIVRIHAWAGMPQVKVVYTFKNMSRSGQATSGAAEEAAQMASHVDADEVVLRLPLLLSSSPAARFGGDPADHTVTLAPGESARLVQGYRGSHDATDSLNPQPAGSGDGSSDPLTNAWANEGPDKIAYDMGGAITGSGRHAPGTVQCAGGAGANQLRVTAVVRDFWQLYPKALSVREDGRMDVELWPADAWRLQVFEGAMKTHEMLFSFERAATTSATSASALHDLANDPPFAASAPTHYKATRVFGDIGTTNPTMTDVSAFRPEHRTRAGAFAAEVLRELGDLVDDRANGNGPTQGHEYGMWHYGDGKTTDGEGAWENQHWSLSRACFVWFAASGNRDLLAFGDTALRCFRDVAVLHSDVGRRYAYSEPGNASVTPNGTSQLGQTRYNPNNKQHHLGHFNGGSMTFESFKGEMLGDHYLLFGDGLSLEVLAEAYNYLRGTWKRHFDARFGGTDVTMSCETRWISNAMFVAVSYHECTGDPEALALARFVLARSRQRQRTVTPRDPGGDGYATGGGFFQTWMFGHMVEALDWYRWIMEDPTVDADIEDAMGWIIGASAGVYDGSGGFGETPGNTSDYGAVNLMLGAGYAGALRSSADSAWRTRAATFLDRQLASIQPTLLGINHKSWAQRFRAGAALLRAFE